MGPRLPDGSDEASPAIARPASGQKDGRPSDPRTPAWLPAFAGALTLGVLERVARGLVRRGVSANAVTCTSIALGVTGGVLLGAGWLGGAALAMVVASLGDALDGQVARLGNGVSVRGALLDAAGDRYQELFLLGGAAVWLRRDGWALVLVLLAIGGSFMVSYGSAKAEALGVQVPGGPMRRAGRAVALCLGTAAAAVGSALVAAGVAPGWAATGPLLVAVGLIALVANASALERLRRIAVLATRTRGPSTRADSRM